MDYDFDSALADPPIIVDILRAAFAEYRGQLDPPSGAERETVESIAEKMKTGHYVEARARALGAGRVRLGVRVALPSLRAAYERRGCRVRFPASLATKSLL